jgi:predicted nucleotidyltransferase
MDIVMNTTPDAKLPDHSSIHASRHHAALPLEIETNSAKLFNLAPHPTGPAKPNDVETATRICYDIRIERDEAISRLQKHDADLKRLGVERLYMFGSTARGEANDDSDVDLFFDYQKGKLGVYELMDVKQYAAGILGRKTDIVTRDSLHKTLREAIEATAVRVFSGRALAHPPFDGHHRGDRTRQWRIGGSIAGSVRRRLAAAMARRARC